MSCTGTANKALTRRTFLGGLACMAATAVTQAQAAAPHILRGAGAFRRIAFNNWRTGEWVNTVYWADGAYIPEALDTLNHILRDWRENEVFRMDAGVIDILAATAGLLESDEPFEIVSGYRTPNTNAMLRRRYKGIARNSYHCKGMAVDITMKSRSVRQISRAALSLHGGGVGRYTRSKFVHLDCGPVRKWDA